MSAQTLNNIQKALQEHFLDSLDEDSADERAGAVIIDWVCMYTLSNIVSIDGKAIVGFTNELVSPDTNPNSQLGLIVWGSNKLAEVLNPFEED